MNKIIILTGKINSGKSTRLFELYEYLINNNIFPIGFISLPIISGNEKQGFTLFDLHSKMKYNFISSVNKIGDIKLGRYFFNEEVFDIVLNNFPVIKKEYIIFFDEFGQLEFQGKGWRTLFNRIISVEFRLLLIVIRKDLLPEFINLTEKNPFEIIDMDNKISLKDKINQKICLF